MKTTKPEPNVRNMEEWDAIYIPKQATRGFDQKLNIKPEERGKRSAQSALATVFRTGK